MKQIVSVMIAILISEVHQESDSNVKICVDRKSEAEQGNKIKTGAVHDLRSKGTFSTPQLHSGMIPNTYLLMISNKLNST